MIYILKKQKYTFANSQKYKDMWNDFLHKRPKRKVLHSPESLKKLVESVSGKSWRGGNSLVAVGIIAESLGISEDCLKKITATKGQRGRPKKSK